MVALSNGVGEGESNDVRDVAIVQLMLRLAKNTRQQPYLNTPYSGTFSSPTKDAIVAFQNDAKLIPEGATAKQTTPSVPSTEKPGRIGKNSETFKRLVASLPARYTDIRVLLSSSPIVYLSGSTQDSGSSQLAIVGDPELEPSFRSRVGQLVQNMFDEHGIVLWLTPTGSRRSFAEQAAETATKAGPGESNHNFGRAVDIGFDGFTWVKGDGTIVTDAPWLNTLELAAKKSASTLWDLRDGVAAKLGLWPLQFERVHLQAFSQATVSNGRSLVALLNGVTVGKMTWSTSYDAANKNWLYKCDLGAPGGTMHAVGSARQIWAGEATVTNAMITSTWNKLGKEKKVWKDADIKPADVDAYRKKLKADFAAADVGWMQWKIVP